MLPTDRVYGDFPLSGEIDLVKLRSNENYSCNGIFSGRQSAEQTLHWGPDKDQDRSDLTLWKKLFINIA